jgi:hypothetical protein
MIIGIDPGPTQSAFVLFDGERVWNPNTVANDVLISVIPFPSHADPNVIVAVEHLQCFGLAVGAETFETAYFIGEIRRACRYREVSFEKVMRSEVKMNLCHSMRAKDANIRQAILDRFGGRENAVGRKKSPGPLYGVSGHVWSALAVAVTAFDRLTH